MTIKFEVMAVLDHGTNVIDERVMPVNQPLKEDQHLKNSLTRLAKSNEGCKKPEDDLINPISFWENVDGWLQEMNE